MEVITTVKEEKKWLGKAVKRVEDPRLISGHGSFIDDLNLGRLYHLAILRSPIPHGKIVRLNADRALRHPGVVAVLTGEDVVKMSSPFPVGIPNPPKYYCMAVDKVRYVGEPVAAVVAKDRYSAEDALELIDVEYEPLEAVVDPERAAQGGAPLLHEDIGSNVAWHRVLRYGDVERAFAEADRVVSIRVKFPKYTSAPLETYSIVARRDERTGVITIWSNFHGPWTMVPVIAKALRTPEEKLRILTPPDIGGGFGIKTSIYPYMTLVALAAIKAGVQVKWIETRREHLMASSSHTDRITYIEAAVKNDGTILGIRRRVFDNYGAYIRPPEPGSLLRPLGNYVGVYRFRNVMVDAYAVLTNKMPTGPNRGYGCQQLYFELERLVDTIASELGLDPAEVRFRNMIGPEMMPYETPTGGIYDNGNFPEALRLALRLIGYDEFREEQRRAWSEGRYIGIGIATIVDPAGSNMGYVTVAYPPEIRESKDYLPKGGSANMARIKMMPNGKVVVSLDSNPQGQGHETTTAQIVAEELGIEMDDVLVDAWLDSHTDLWTVSSGSYASRFSAFQASAVAIAARRLREKLIEIAAYMLNAKKEELTVGGGKVYVKGDPERAVSFRRIAGTAYWNPTELPPTIEPMLEASAWFNIPNLKPPTPDDRVNSSGVYSGIAEAAIVEVDAKTGEINIRKFVSVHDSGRVLNPMIVEGQILGSIMHGLAGAMYEELYYDESGQHLTSTFMDYLCPTALEMPTNIEIAHIESPSPFTVLGAKGVGEASTESTPVVIANAVEDALRPLGVKILELPLTPSKLWSLIEEAKRRKSHPGQP